MLNIQKQLDRAYKFSKLLKNDCIREEIEHNLKGYSLKNMEFEDEKWICSYIDENDNHLSLTISFNNVELMKSTNNKIERIAVDENLILIHRTVDKREKGLIYSIIEKEFAPSENFKNQYALIDLIERRYTLTKENIETLMDNIDFDKATLIHILLKLMKLENKINLKEKCDYYSEFSTYAYIVGDLGYGYIDDTLTFLNGRNISKEYKIKGQDKIYRVFDLYNGIINTRNEKDIISINSGHLGRDAYDLKKLEGITDQEDLLVGKSLENVPEDYLQYLKQMLYNKFGYEGDISLDRESMLSCILYNSPNTVIARICMAKTLGIPYWEFEKLDLDEQYRLFEEKTGKKYHPVKYKPRLYVDGIAIDESHWIRIVPADKSIDELTSGAPKKTLKKIFNRKK